MARGGQHTVIRGIRTAGKKIPQRPDFRFEVRSSPQSLSPGFAIRPQVFDSAERSGGSFDWRLMRCVRLSGGGSSFG
jgi:hypothetical protein